MQVWVRGQVQIWGQAGVTKFVTQNPPPTSAPYPKFLYLRHNCNSQKSTSCTMTINTSTTYVIHFLGIPYIQSLTKNLINACDMGDVAQPMITIDIITMTSSQLQLHACTSESVAPTCDNTYRQARQTGHGFEAEGASGCRSLILFEWGQPQVLKDTQYPTPPCH